MAKTITMSNMEIYDIANKLANFNDNDRVLPVKVNFYLQKNINDMIQKGQEIETARVDIIKRFGEASEENPDQVVVPAEKMSEATKEINDLFSLEQEITFKELKLEWFDNIDLSSQQVAAISYMISDDEI